jgi:amidase
MPTPAYPHDHSPDQRQRRIMVDGTLIAYMDQLVWPGVATLPSLPATAVPIDRSADGLPIGVQIVGPAFEDHTPILRHAAGAGIRRLRSAARLCLMSR